MKFRLFSTVLLLVFCAELNAKIIDDSVSYSIGIQLAISLQKSGMLDKFEQNASFLEGFADMKAGTPKMTLKDMERVVTTHLTNIMEKEKADNAANSKAFLEHNAKDSGVVVLPSGLQYKIVKQGTGKIHPKPVDTVEVHYRGWLVDGKMFDSSYDSGQPVQFLLSSVIKGWIEGLQYATEGGKIQLFIPPELGYGDISRAGSPIGPNSVLIFEIELLKIAQGVEEIENIDKDITNE